MDNIERNNRWVGAAEELTRTTVNGAPQLETLESAFGRLSFNDPSARNQQTPFLDYRWTNRSSPSGINSGAGSSRSGYMFTPPQRLPLQNDYLNGYNPSTPPPMLNNNGMIPYLSRNRFMDLSPLDSINGRGYVSPWRNNNMENGSTASLARDGVFFQQLQARLDDGSQENIALIFNYVIPQICTLMVEPLGNQLVQRLMEKCSSQQISAILDIVIQDKYRFINVYYDPLGTRAIQLLFKCLDTEDQIALFMAAITMLVYPLSRSNHAKHVILQCFNKFSPMQNRILIEAIARDCYRIAIDQHGCCMLQQCLSSGCVELKRRLIAEITMNSLRLCVNCYGNYVVQYVVDLGDLRVTEDLVKSLIGSYSYLSRNKYGSHAVQKFLKIQGIDASLIVNDLLTDIGSLLLDPFGNYVVQTVWFVSQEDVRQKLWVHIKNNSRFMRCNKYGNKILEKLSL